MEAVNWLRHHDVRDCGTFLIAVLLAKEILSLLLRQLLGLVINDDEVGADEHLNGVLSLVVVERVQDEANFLDAGEGRTEDADLSLGVLNITRRVANHVEVALKKVCLVHDLFELSRVEELCGLIEVTPGTSTMLPKLINLTVAD